jgi:hypothetical protein
MYPAVLFRRAADSIRSGSANSFPGSRPLNLSPDSHRMLKRTPIPYPNFLKPPTPNRCAGSRDPHLQVRFTHLTPSNAYVSSRMGGQSVQPIGSPGEDREKPLTFVERGDSVDCERPSEGRSIPGCAKATSARPLCSSAHRLRHKDK